MVASSKNGQRQGRGTKLNLIVPAVGAALLVPPLLCLAAIAFYLSLFEKGYLSVARFHGAYVHYDPESLNVYRVTITDPRKCDGTLAMIESSAATLVSELDEGDVAAVMPGPATKDEGAGNLTEYSRGDTRIRFENGRLTYLRYDKGFPLRLGRGKQLKRLNFSLEHAEFAFGPVEKYEKEWISAP